MFFRYILVDSLAKIRSRFNLPDQDVNFEPNYNVLPGQFLPVITSDQPEKVLLMRYGFTPFWEKRERMILEARAEGDYNVSNTSGLISSKGIIIKREFRKPIRSQRCLIIGSAFAIINMENEPYLVFLKDHNHPFAFAGIWDLWEDPKDGTKLESFCIVTTVANDFMQHLGMTRMPVILQDKYEKLWLKNDTPLFKITNMLLPYHSDIMNAYPIDKRILISKENLRTLIEPVGDKLVSDIEIYLKMSHYSSHKLHRHKDAGTTSMEERVKSSH